MPVAARSLLLSTLTLLLACASPSERFADALASGDVEAVRAALAGGADVNERIERLAPLCIALDRRAGKAVIDLLLEAGADPRGRCRGGGATMSVAAAAGDVAAAQTLLEAGARLEATSHLGETPLFAASCRGHLDMVTFLLDAGHAHGRNQRTDARTPIGCANFRGHAEVSELLAERVEVEPDPIPAPGGGHEGHNH